MDMIFVALYGTLSLMLGFLAVEAVSSVRSAQAWGGRVHAQGMTIRAERRGVSLPFVGTERRQAEDEIVTTSATEAGRRVA